MNKQTLANTLNTKKYKHALIIDDNKSWNHNDQYSRVSNYIDGDLHDFFDLVNGEQLFPSIKDQFDLIFIGEIFHVINLQTLVYNLELAVINLTTGGLIQISINQNSIDTAKTTQQKIISRLQFLKQYTVIEEIDYIDEDNLEWTLLTLQKNDIKQVNDQTITDAIQIGSEICQLVNSGKNIKKLKVGFLQSNSKLDNEQFKAAFTTIDELMSIYLQNQLITLKPCFKHQFLLNLSDFIFENRKSLEVCDINLLQEGIFKLCLDNYKQSTIIFSDQFVASYADVLNLIWNQCLKKKADNKLISQINQLKE
ncbi:hypothetical protein R2F61_00445 [Mollicutes bacterium LVI A0078]|nr:hypothetical protein RZE84_00450 [Mollicutes bacterium LVI A0075]WOO91049.1 hypothetical protein R2F61_00445 [Mollicutes bacterium LVI A0078]